MRMLIFRHDYKIPVENDHILPTFRIYIYMHAYDTLSKSAKKNLCII